MEMTLMPTPDEATAAAIAAALGCFLEEDRPPDAPAPALARSAWSVADRLAAQGIPPSRGAGGAAWASAARADRARRWSYGIVGI
jgi:hypothetical protein